MFSWFKKLFSRKPNEDFYTPGERLLYGFFDGQKKVLADPMVLWRKLMEKGSDLAIDIQVADSPSKDKYSARIKMIEKIRWIFSLKSFEDGGLEEVKCEELLEHFSNWCDRVKKNSMESQISQIVPSQPIKPSSTENPPTKNSLVSGLTDQEINKENLQSSQSVGG